MDASRRGEGAAAGHLWHFIRQVCYRDLLAITATVMRLHVAEVVGEASEKERRGNVGYRRAVRWLTADAGIDRQYAAAALHLRTKVYATTADASDLVGHIPQAVGYKSRMKGAPATVRGGHAGKLLEFVRSLLADGRVEPYKFQHIVAAILQSVGTTIDITPRRFNQIDDIFASLRPVGGLIELKLIVQVEHYDRMEDPLRPEAVLQLMSGMEKHDAWLGTVVSIGAISDNARAEATRQTGAGYNITLFAGDSLSLLYLDWRGRSQLWFEVQAIPRAYRGSLTQDSKECCPAVPSADPILWPDAGPWGACSDTTPAPKALPAVAGNLLRTIAPGN